jgi:Ca2+-binding EF-hand superfamily protein
MRFHSLDGDGAGALTFKELQYGLGKLGFTEFDKLASLFKRIDADRNGVLDFNEFMVLIMVFSVDRGDLSFMFSFKENAKMVKDCFSMMDRALCLFDKEGKRKLSIEQVGLSSGF